MGASAKSSQKINDEYDFIIVGSGAGAVPAALRIKEAGLRPLIIEKEDLFGGSTAMSGGILWIPNNPVMLRHDRLRDSDKKAQAYMDSTIGAYTKGSSAQRRSVFLEKGPEMVALTEKFGMEWEVAGRYCDYYDEYPGGIGEYTRSIQGKLFNVNRLGKWRKKLRSSGVADAPINSPDVAPLSLLLRSYKGIFTGLKIAWYFSQRLIGRSLTGTGRAVQGRLFEIALENDIPISFGAAVTNFVVKAGKVTGVIINRDGIKEEIKATRGVLINAGGFERNSEMRKKYQPAGTSAETSYANPGNTGELIEVAAALGADLEYLEQSWWLPSSRLPNGNMQMHVFDRAKPNCIIVNKQGKRFFNEACSYMEAGQKMFEQGNQGKCWFIFDKRHASRYPLVRWQGGYSIKKLIEAGVYKVGNNIEELATNCKIDPMELKNTVDKWNRMSKKGYDEDFQKGQRYYDVYYGDETIKPNPCMGSINNDPFYAIEIFPGDVGTAGGIVTDEFARVLKADGSCIEGLYATGNCTSSVMGDKYLGAGASIGASATFAYIAAEHAVK